MQLPSLTQIRNAQSLVYRFMPPTPQYTWPLLNERLGTDASGDVVINFADYHPDGSFERQLRDYKIKLAVSAVREHNGNKTLAARSLCISRAYLHRLLRLAEADTQFAEAGLRETRTA